MPRGKAGMLMKDLRGLHTHVNNRMERADQLHEIAEDLGKHLSTREIAMQKYYAAIPPAMDMELSRLETAARSDNPLFSQEAKVKISRMHGSMNRPSIPWVPTKIRKALKGHYIRDRDKHKYDYVINRVVGKDPPDPKDLEKFIAHANELKRHSDHLRTQKQPTSPKSSRFREEHRAITRVRHEFKAGVDRPEMRATAEDTVAELEAQGDLQKWRSLRDYLQMYERVTQPGTKALSLIHI